MAELKVGDIVFSSLSLGTITKDNNPPVGEIVPSNIEMKVVSIKKDMALCSWTLNGIERQKEFPLTSLTIKEN